MSELNPEQLLKLIIPHAAVRVQGPVEDLCLRIGLDGFRPEPFTLGRVVGGSWAGRLIDSPESSEIALVDDALEVRIEGAGFLSSELLDPFERSSPASLRLDNGLSIEAQLGMVTARAFPGRACTLRLHDWVIRQAVPLAWIGTIPRDFVKHARTNLALGGADSTRVNATGTNFRLTGNYIWNLIGTNDEVIVVIDSQGTNIDRHLIIADFCALQFAFGVPLSIPLGLIGVAPQGETVEWMSSHAFTRRRHAKDVNADSPVPNYLSADGLCWVAEFFEKLAKRLADPKDHVSWVAWTSHLASIQDDLDSAYLKIHVALEALCHEVPKPKRGSLVKNSAAWKGWIDGLSKEIAQHAKPESAQKLTDKMKAAEQPPATDIVEDTLEALVLKPSPEILAEIKARNRSVHRFLMNSGVERDLLTDWDRVRKLRTLLIAFLANRIGYQGQISNWTRNMLGNALPAEWWPQKGGEIAGRTFAYLRTSPPEPESPDCEHR